MKLCTVSLAWILVQCLVVGVNAVGRFLPALPVCLTQALGLFD